MDLDSIEELDEIRPSVYRASMKLVSLQRRCHMDIVCLRHIKVALQLVGGAKCQQEVVLNRQAVTQTLDRMFHNASQEVPGHVTVENPEETCSLMFRLYDRSQAGYLSADSLQTALIGLSADSLLAKYRALVSLAENGSGSVSRSGLRSLLQDLSQIPAAVQEEGVFGGVEVAVKSCFNGVLTPMAGKQHVLSWLQSEPHLLLWLPTLYHLSVSQRVTHSVRCHTCKTFPITGLRYRCMKCFNVQLCQSCFLLDRETAKHKSRHPVMEFCTQPTWRESLSSLMRSTRHALLPRRYTLREADMRILMRVERGETHLSRPPPPTDLSTPLAVSAVNQSPSSDTDVSHDASVQSPACSKSLQIDGEPQQALSLLAEVRNLQRDKWLLEQQLQAWRLTVQSEQGILGSRCSEMEVTMETMREHNLNLQMMLTQALNKMEAQHHGNKMPQSVRRETESDVTTMSDSERNEEEGDEEHMLLGKNPCSGEEQLTSSPTMHQVTPPSHDIHCEDKVSAGDRFDCPRLGHQDGAEGGEPKDEETCLSEEVEEQDCGTCSPDELLQETVERLKTEMETDKWRERRTDDRRSELLGAADQVGDSVHHLVDTVRDGTGRFQDLKPAAFKASSQSRIHQVCFALEPPVVDL